MSSQKSGLPDLLAEHEPATDSLIPILQDIQDAFGYISEGALSGVSAYLNLSESEIYGVATFYTQFRFERQGDHIVHACCGTACHVKRAPQVIQEVSRRLGLQPGETSADCKYSMATVACIGSCALAPVVVIDGNVHGRVEMKKLKRLLDKIQ